MSAKGWKRASFKKLGHSDLTGVNSAQLLFGGSESKVDENEGL